MYAVIKTGGKQYRVQAGDLLIVEKLDGEPGAKLAFDQVLMIGEGAAVTLGEPTVAGASVSATLVETRKGEKIKVFKKIRRQGYRRTRGHRQYQSVLRVTGIAGDGKSETWDGTVDLTPLATLNARARNLARGMEASEAKRSADKAAKPAKASAPAKAAKPASKKAAAQAKAAKPAPPTKAEAKIAPAPTKAPKLAAPAKTKAKAKTKARPEAKPVKPAKAEAKAARGKTKAPKAAAPAKGAAAKKADKLAPNKVAAEKSAAKPAAKKSTAKAGKPTGKKG